MKRLILTVVLASLILSTGVSAQPQSTPENEDEDDGDVIIDLDQVTEAINDLIEELEDFTGTWDTTLKELLIAVLFAPFRTLLQQLVRQVTLVLTNTPSVYPNPAVEEVHREVLLVTYVLSGLAISASGILYMYGPILGVSLSQVRKILPRIVLALVFASVSLPLLQYTVEFADALVYAFAPSGLTMSISQASGLSVTLVLVWVLNAFILLAVVLLFIIRSVYILFVAAISPLIALAWAFPPAKRYADSFIAGYWTALAMAPLDVLVLRFVFTLLEGQGASGLQSLSNWILGMAGFTLLLWIPFQLYGASQAAVGQAYVVARSVKSRFNQYREKKSFEKFQKQQMEESSKDRRRSNKYRKPGEDDDDD